jgi:hypothetical protein
MYDGSEMVRIKDRATLLIQGHADVGAVEREPTAWRVLAAKRGRILIDRHDKKY